MVSSCIGDALVSVGVCKRGEADLARASGLVWVGRGGSGRSMGAGRGICARLVFGFRFSGVRGVVSMFVREEERSGTLFFSLSGSGMVTVDTLLDVLWTESGLISVTSSEEAWTMMTCE